MDYSLIRIIEIAAQVVFGVLLSLLVMFALIIQVTDPNEYNITYYIDPASGLSLYNPNSEVALQTGFFENKAVMNNYGFHEPPVLRLGK